jgi:hypothetical protein
MNPHRWAAAVLTLTRAASNIGNPLNNAPNAPANAPATL